VLTLYNQDIFISHSTLLKYKSKYLICQVNILNNKELTIKNIENPFF